jgi:hypothetical protein
MMPADGREFVHPPQLEDQTTTTGGDAKEIFDVRDVAEMFKCSREEISAWRGFRSEPSFFPRPARRPIFSGDRPDLRQESVSLAFVGPSESAPRRMVSLTS